jgi:hypothetical protein
MKKLIALLWILAGLAVAGCAETVSTIKIEASLIEPSRCTGLSCDMGNYQISFSPLSDASQGISFAIKNKCAEPMWIIWDESAYLETVHGTPFSMKGIHTGVRLMDRNTAQSPSMVVPGTSLWDEVTPSENIFWTDSGWHIAPLISIEHPETPAQTPLQMWNQFVSTPLPGLQSKVKAGQVIGLYLTIKVGDVKKQQKFNLRIDSVQDTGNPSQTTHPSKTTHPSSSQWPK